MKDGRIIDITPDSEVNGITLPNVPAFPLAHIRVNKLGQPEPIAEPGMSLLDYHIAHAPDMPDWWRHEYIEGGGDANAGPLDLLIAWRYNYAVNILLQRPNYIK